MSYAIYVNDHNGRATIHEIDCHHVRQNGGTGKGFWVDSLDTYEDAQDYIDNYVDSNYECNDCSSCL
ncbi:MAG: Unknown protein [uncultured Sulfurovum sp.]|uniref:Uncharacterized protein n=1 Tax=uncultured Sulfurovum sp. TaxID=269237 RepID=A0A6S6SCX5_9BACT|nr:MAG: Unknown protein [uncultured Sulfurovum sp.]